MGFALCRSNGEHSTDADNQSEDYTFHRVQFSRQTSVLVFIVVL